MYYFLVIYLNAKNKTIFRINNTYPNYEIGSTTSMGWLVLDIQQYCDEMRMFIGVETMKKLYEKNLSERSKYIDKLEKKKKFLKKIYDIFR